MTTNKQSRDTSAVPLPEPAFIRYGLGSGDDFYYSADQLRAYGDAREAAGRADAVPVGEVVANPTYNPAPRPGDWSGVDRDVRWTIEGGCFSLPIGTKIYINTAPQSMTTQGEAVQRECRSAAARST